MHIQTMSRTIGFYFLLCCFIHSWSEIPQQVITVAHNNYKAFIRAPLNQIDFCKEHGITDKDIAGAITLGQPFQLQCITPQSIQSYKPTMTVSQLCEKTEIYMFPVVFNGVAKLFLDVSTFGTDHFEIGTLGESSLCKQINSIESNFSSRNGFSILLIQNFQTQQYLFHIPQIDQVNLTIIASNPSRGDGYKRLATATESIERLKVLLKEVMN